MGAFIDFDRNIAGVFVLFGRPGVAPNVSRPLVRQSAQRPPATRPAAASMAALGFQRPLPPAEIHGIDESAFCELGTG
ncbi:hypothetical protein C1878_09100 [Gordonibacter sp. 28C]|nr:hypothetical protein C1878_09100 [Gordonibacter sp. 28C]